MVVVIDPPENLVLRGVDERRASEGWYPCAWPRCRVARGNDAWLFGKVVVQPLSGRCWRWRYAVPEGSLVLVGRSFVKALVFSLANGLEGAIL